VFLTRRKRRTPYEPVHICLSRLSAHFYNDLGTYCSTMPSNHVATVVFDTIVAFDIIVAFVSSLLALLTSSPVLWRKEHLLNFSVLQSVHVSNFVNIIFHLHLRLPNGLAFRFTYKTFLGLCLSYLSHDRYRPLFGLSHLSWFHYPVRVTCPVHLVFIGLVILIFSE
jgi:hypothetical protein